MLASAAHAFFSRSFKAEDSGVILREREDDPDVVDKTLHLQACTVLIFS